MPTRVRTALLPLALVAAAIGLAACSSTGDDEETTTGATDVERTTVEPADPDQPLSPDEDRGRALFVETCGACHTLDAAGTQGAIGPNLDELQLDEQDVLRAIEIGGTGSGQMPKGLYEGQDAREVARFVANSGPGV